MEAFRRERGGYAPGGKGRLKRGCGGAGVVTTVARMDTQIDEPTPRSELKSHEHTYVRMLGMLKWGTIAVALLVALVVWLIS